MSLSADRTTFLPTEPWPDGVERRLLDEVDSTNSEAQRIAPDLLRPTWILARRQTMARGRRGRHWHAPEGNLSATLVMRPEGPPQRVALHSFVAALALADALERAAAGRATIALKWPNDVLLNGGKVAGILLESAGQGGAVSHLAIGIGVNLAAAPPPDAVEPGAMRPVSLVGETGERLSPEAFLGLLAPAFARIEAQFRTFGFAPIRNAWLARAARLGAPITARTGAEVLTGTFDTIDESGALVLITNSGRRTVAAADIFF